MSNMAALLPSHDGFLPYWLLLVSSSSGMVKNIELNIHSLQTSAASPFNIIACYASPETGRQIYQGPASAVEGTPLSARLFWAWKFLAAVVRTYAAYSIGDRGIYVVALSTYMLALGHFTSEWLVYVFQKGRCCSFLSSYFHDVLDDHAGGLLRWSLMLGVMLVDVGDIRLSGSTSNSNRIGCNTGNLG